MNKIYKKYKQFIPLIIVGLIITGFIVYSTQAKDYLQVLDDPYSETENGYGWGEEGLLGAQRPSDFKTTLAESLSATASTTEGITLSSVTTKDGHALTTSDVGDFICLKINPGSSNQELVCCTGGITGTTFNDCSRGYSLYQDAVEGSKEKSHSPGETVIISNDDAYLAHQYPGLDTDNTFYGTQTFASTTAISRINIGNGAITYDKVIYAYNGETNLPYLVYDESANVWSFSNDGLSSTAIGSGASVYTAGNGLDLTSSVFTIATSTLSGLRFDNNGHLQIATSSGTGIYIDTDGTIKIATSTNFTWTGTHSFNASSTFSDTLHFGNATTTKTLSVGELYFGSDNGSQSPMSYDYVDNTTATSTGTTVAELFSFTINANHIDSDSVIKCEANGTRGGAGGGKSVIGWYLGNELIASTTDIYAVAGTETYWNGEATIYNREATNLQWVFLKTDIRRSIESYQTVQSSTTEMAIDLSSNSTFTILGVNNTEPTDAISVNSAHCYIMK